MPWTLEIYHIDVLSSGDATLIKADNGLIVRTALIDGGRAGNAHRVHSRVVAAGIAALNVMVTTHYDEDHMSGLTSLLNGGNARYAATRIYDQGEQGQVTIKSKKRKGVAAVLSDPEFFGREPRYSNYLTAVEAHGTRARQTNTVLSNQSVDANLTSAGWEDPDWLVGKEILWDGVLGGVPANAPTLRCVSGNQYILQANGGKNLVTSSTLNVEQGKNAKSLGFLLQFGNFKYYVGGDLEAVQEDGSAWNGAGYTVNASKRGNSLMHYLNQTNNDAGRVHAMKASHHGSQYASSPAFITRLRPRVVFISCGTDNQYGHPEQTVVDTLQADGNVERYCLTGEAVNGATNLGNKARVAGVWPQGQANPTADGDILLTMTQAQAHSSPPQFEVVYDRPDAGTNVGKNPAFAYVPYGTYTMNF